MFHPAAVTYDQNYHVKVWNSNFCTQKRPSVTLTPTRLFSCQIVPRNCLLTRIVTKLCHPPHTSPGKLPPHSGSQICKSLQLQKVEGSFDNAISSSWDCGCPGLHRGAINNLKPKWPCKGAVHFSIPWFLMVAHFNVILDCNIVTRLLMHHAV